MNAQFWIDKLQLQKHPEGGYFRETYRAEGLIQSESLPFHFQGKRNYSTAIYFLLTSEAFSAFHRIQSDEIWHFYAGSALEILYFDKDKSLKIIYLGNNLEKNEVFQAVVPANCWFASRVIAVDSFALVGCTVAPGFDFQDFELVTYAQLAEIYPAHTQIIRELTRT